MVRRAEFVLKVSVFLQGVRRINNYIILQGFRRINSYIILQRVRSINNYIILHKIKELTVVLFKIVGREEIYRKHFIMCFMF